MSPHHTVEIKFGQYTTWCKVFGDPSAHSKKAVNAQDGKEAGKGAKSSTKVPLVILHGGPAIPHQYMSPHENLYSKDYLDGTPLVFYDQIGCGHSSHPHDVDESIDPAKFYTVDLFMDELDAVLKHFKLDQEGSQFDLLGHSWGGMLAAVSIG